LKAVLLLDVQDAFPVVTVVTAHNRNISNRGMRAAKSGKNAKNRAVSNNAPAALMTIENRSWAEANHDVGHHRICDLN
jgi:hypothetical protein